MITLISIFYASLFGIILMIILKSREVKTGRPNIIARMFAWSDNFFQTIFNTIGQTIAYINRHTFIALAQWIAFHILTHIRNAYITVRAWAHEYPHTRKVIDMVRGRGEVKRHGASFYLKRISNEDW